MNAVKKGKTSALLPLIGVCCRMDVDTDRFYLRKHYSDAVYHAGGTPVLLPLIPERRYAREIVKQLDGIILSGSNSDLDPHRYGEEPHPRLGSVMTVRDQTDLVLLDEVFKEKKPLLGICFGIQVLNVFLGGTLWQDIESQVEGAIKHAQSSPDEYRSHLIRIEPKSLLYALNRDLEVKVNSYHHQAIQKVAPSLRVVATAADGIVEGVELRSKDHWVLGVQWHPEIGWEGDDLSKTLFAHFVDCSRNSQ